MSKVWVLGDAHLSAETKWQAVISKNVVDWIRSHELNVEENEVILAGDLIDKYGSSPPSHHLVLQLLTAFKCHKVHVVVGNHDIEKTESGTGQNLAYAYIDTLSSPERQYLLYEYPSVFKAGNLNCLAIPYYKAPTNSLVDLKHIPDGHSSSLEKWGIDYSDKCEYDLCIAHHFVSHDKASFVPEEVTVDLRKLSRDSKIHAKKVLAGHVHVSDSDPDVYLGSLYAKKIDEQGQRYYWVHDGSKWHKYVMPTLCTFISVKYGEKLPEIDLDSDPLSTPVYTITQCPSIDKAHHYYGDDVLIRKVVSSWDHISKQQEFSDIDPSLYSGSREGMISKLELMSRFEKMVLDDASEWKKVDVSKDTLEKAVTFIRELAVKTTNNKDVTANQVLLSEN